MFLDHAGTYYDDVVGVVADDGTSYTYGAVVERVNRLSNALVDLEFSAGDRACVLSPNTHWCLEAMFGVQQVGGIFSPLNYRLLPDDYRDLLADADPTVVLADAAYADVLEGCRDVVPTATFVRYHPERSGAAGWLDYETLLADSSGTGPDRPELAEDHPATINYTSGTTGEPKGVVRTHRTEFWNATIQAHNLGLNDGAVYLWTLPMFHVNGWGAMYAVTGWAGTHVCLRDFSPARVFELIREHGVNVLAGPPTVLNRLVEFYEEEEPALDDRPLTVATAGAPPPRATIEAVEDELGWRLKHFYGHTESGPYTNSESPRRFVRDGRLTVKAKQGIPVPGNQLRVVDEDGNDVPRDDETLGEVVLRGNLVFDRYWRKPESTADAFDDRVRGWFHSGDLGTVDEHGFVTIKDRKKDIIISGGENISSFEIEDTLYDLPGVQRVAVIPVPHPDWGETPKAIIVRDPDVDLTVEAAHDHCRERLAGYKRPRVVEFVDELPETATGKVEKHKLREAHWGDEDRPGGG
jgi:fatty-acyl-CoA synthase